MLIRQSLNFTAHLAAGVAVGALLYVALRAMGNRAASTSRYPSVAPEVTEEPGSED